MIAHVLGLPLEETVLQLVPAGAAMVATVALAGRASLERLRAVRSRRRTAASRSPT